MVYGQGEGCGTTHIIEAVQAEGGTLAILETFQLCIAHSIRAAQQVAFAEKHLDGTTTSVIIGISGGGQSSRNSQQPGAFASGNTGIDAAEGTITVDDKTAI